ncbi:MAG TPA: hypothetical protein VMT85_17315 [Thermoanaerobaculia bacterium]|nr:hypothetical protein [Thermoanaerobaculia bacterium]
MGDPTALLVALAAGGVALVVTLALIAVRRAGSRPDGARSAERFAELLVLEIELYHADELEAARRERRILSTFGGDIARARAMFEARFPRGTPGWLAFDQEVVRKLAGGDPGLLGEPGPGRARAG